MRLVIDVETLVMSDNGILESKFQAVESIDLTDEEFEELLHAAAADALDEGVEYDD